MENGPQGMPSMYIQARTAHGFTLIEQIIALAIAGILTCLAIPSMQALLRHHRARTATRSLSGALHATRMLSIERQRRTLFCPSHDGRTCSGDGSWDEGWLIGIDRDDDGQPDATPLVAHPPLDGVRVRASRGRSHVYFHPNGSAPGSNLTLAVCPRRGHPDRISAVVVSNAGRIRLERLDAARCR
jgi:type IV fimbrial biogenesis protein FimT